MAHIDDLIEGYTFVARPLKRGRAPPHLAKYQQQFSEAAKRAAEMTQHLGGERRVRKMNQLIKEILCQTKS